MVNAFALLRPVLHTMPPEMAHNLGLWALRNGWVPAARAKIFPSLAVNVLGMHFLNPIGLAAGFDKNAVAVDALLKQGFGFVETGTVTPQPQPGNPRPRIFRLYEDRAVINRLGFNNEGLEAYLRHFTRRDKNKGIAGANIGKNKNATDAVADYVAGLEAVYPHADYVTVNISSPNTQGLRDLQQREALNDLLAALNATRNHCITRHERKVPLLLKVAPDLTAQEQEDIAASVIAHGIDGLIVSNTTVSRPETLRSAYASETGGLSGRPLFELSTACLKRFYQITGGTLPLIGVGGISSASDAYTKIRAGATLVQLYTALVYGGFGVVRTICTGLADRLAQDEFTSIKEAIGKDAASG